MKLIQLLLSVLFFSSLVYGSDPAKIDGTYLLLSGGPKFASITKTVVDEHGVKRPEVSYLLVVFLFDPDGKNPVFVFGTHKILDISKVLASKNFEVSYNEETNSYDVVGKNDDGIIIYMHSVSLDGQISPPEEKEEEEEERKPVVSDPKESIIT